MLRSAARPAACTLSDRSVALAPAHVLATGTRAVDPAVDGAASRLGSSAAGATPWSVRSFLTRAVASAPAGRPRTLRPWGSDPAFTNHPVRCFRGTDRPTLRATADRMATKQELL